MDKIKDLAPLGLFCAFGTKLIVFGASLPEMGTMFAIASIIGIATYMEKNKKISDFTSVINQQNGVIQQMAAKQAEMKLDFEKLRNEMVGVRLKDGFKKVG